MRNAQILRLQWNSSHFALGGACAGAAYAFLLCVLVGLVSLPNLSLLFILLVLGAFAGAAITGGIAALRNYLMEGAGRRS